MKALQDEGYFERRSEKRLMTYGDMIRRKSRICVQEKSIIGGEGFRPGFQSWRVSAMGERELIGH